MTSTTKFSALIHMLQSFVEGTASSRGTTYVQKIEGEFARLGLDDEGEFSDLQHALAMYRGYEEDTHAVVKKARITILKLSAK